jgi:hypothetical protein
MTKPTLDTPTILAKARALTSTIREQQEEIDAGRRLPEPLVDALSRCPGRGCFGLPCLEPGAGPR